MEKKHPTCVEVTGMVELAEGTQAFMCTRYCPREPMTPGQAAFEAWNRLTHDSADDYWKWESLGPEAVERWEAIANAAIEQHEEDQPRMYSSYD